MGRREGGVGRNEDRNATQRGGERTKGGRERIGGREGEGREVGRKRFGRKERTVSRLLNNETERTQEIGREGGKN